MKQLIMLLFISLFLANCQSDQTSDVLGASTVKSQAITGDEYQSFDDELWYVILTTTEEKLQSNRELLKKFNEENGYVERKASGIFLGVGKNKIPLIVMRRFASKSEAEAYSQKIKENKIGENIQEALPIGQANYRLLLKNKNLQEYQTFYKKFIAD